MSCQKKLDGQTPQENWIYTDEVKRHFLEPQNFVIESPKGYNGLGMVGSPACGDMMKVWIKIKNNKIISFKWQTFGCASAIATTSVLSEMVTENGGLPVEQALKITPQMIVKRLGDLPTRKIHCSVLGDQALRAAIEDWQKKNQKRTKK